MSADVLSVGAPRAECEGRGANRARRCLALLALAVAMVPGLGVGLAGAQATGDTGYPTVPTRPTTDPCTSDTRAPVCGTSAAVPHVGGNSGSHSLVTGGDVALLTVLGLAALGSGAALMLLLRRRPTEARGPSSRRV
jgi:hypothetical protein